MTKADIMSLIRPRFELLLVVLGHTVVCSTEIIDCHCLDFQASLTNPMLHGYRYLEDCGAGDAIDRSLGTASGHAIKGAITDAMKRAARHFGEKTGNALYHSGFSANNAPMTLKDAFEQFDVQRAKTRFGFEKDKAANQNAGASQQCAAATNQRQTNTKTAPYKPTPYTSNQPKQTPTNSYAAHQTAKPMTQSKTTQAATNMSTTVQKTPYNTNSTKPAAAPYVTPYQGANAVTTNMNQTQNRTASAVEFSQYTATPSVKKNTFTTHEPMGNCNKENSNPQQHNMTTQQAASAPSGGLNLPPRPSTSRAQQQSSMADGMLGLASSILAMNGQSSSTALPSQAKPGNTTVKNPYNALG